MTQVCHMTGNLCSCWCAETKQGGRIHNIRNQQLAITTTCFQRGRKKVIKVIEIDGSAGEGGGQVVRTSLALSLVTGTPFVIRNVRGKRKKPGLRNQHVTAARAAAEVGEATLAGDEPGSNLLEFHPQTIKPGEYNFSIGTAGSTCLVVQTVLPALLTAGTPSTIDIEGGTHNPMAPVFEYLDRVYLPLLQRMGVQTYAKLHRHGLYPKGGGSAEFKITPASDMQGFDLMDRGAEGQHRVQAVVANLPEHIAQRECDTILRLANWQPSQAETCEVEADSPGNILLIEFNFEHVTELFTALGERRVKAEDVAKRIWRQASRYLKSGVAVGEHLADQLMLPLAIAASRGGKGGKYCTGKLSLHAVTQADIIGRFLDVPISVEEDGDSTIVSVAP